MKNKIIATSILSIVMCLSLICGATFALFTDTDTVNVAVTSGKVQVNAVVDQANVQVISNGEVKWRTEKTFANGGNVDFSDGNTISLNLVTPGDAVLFAIKIENLSNIAIRYRTALKVVEGEKLFSALNVYVADSEEKVKEARAAANKTDYINEGILFDGATRVSPWSDPIDPIDGENKTYKTVYILVDFPYLATDQSEYMNETAKIAYTVEAVQGNASEADLNQITTQNVTPIYTLNDLLVVADNVSRGITYEGKTIALMNDIDLKGMEWTPIGTKEAPFKGTLTSYNESAAGTYDLRNTTPATVYTIKRLNVNAVNGGHAGLIGYLGNGGTVSNIKVDTATIVGDATGAGFNVGTIVACAHSETLIENCTVVNATLTGHDYMGGIVGSTYGAVKNCSVESVELMATPYQLASGKYDGGTKVGGILGFVQSDAGTYEVTNNAAKNVTITAYRDMGGIAGALLSNKTTATGNTVENVKLIANRKVDYAEANRDLNAAAGVGRNPNGVEVAVTGSNSLTLKGATPAYEADPELQLILDGATIVATNGNAITVPAGYAHTILVKGENTLQGGTDASGIYAEGNVTIVGETGSKLAVTANGGADTEDGSAKGGIYAVGNVSITSISDLVANGYGKNGYGIGGANVTITNTNISYAKGGFVQQNFIKDTKYGKSEPEGAPAIGGAVILLDNVTATKIEGGSKAAGIGARFWQPTNVTIKNSVLTEVIGGNASAAIGGSRIASDGKNQTTTVNIVNSMINAYGGEFGAGIGSGYNTHCASTAQGLAPKNTVNIDATSVINAEGGKYGAGIGGGYHAGNVEVNIAEGATITAKSGAKFYKAAYWSAQDIGYGVVDPARDVDNLGYIGITCTEHFLQLGEALKACNKIVLLADIDLSGTAWTPVVLNGVDFMIEGNGHTINGMTVENNAFGALIGKNNGADMTFKDITFTNVSLTGTNADGEVGAGVILGWYEDHSKSTVVIDNCHVIGMNVTDYKYTGGFVGYTSNGGGTMTITNSSVKNANLISTYTEVESGKTVAKGHIGGLVGRVDCTTITGCVTENVTITTSRVDRAGEICGTVTDSTKYSESNNTSDVEIIVPAVEITATNFKSSLSSGGTLKMTEDIAIDDGTAIQAAATIDFDGNTLSRATSGGNPFAISTTEPVVIKNAVFESVKGSAVVETRTDGANITFKDCVFNNLSSPSTGNTGMQVYANNVTVIFENCTFNNMPILTNSSYPEGIKLVFNNCNLNWEGDNCPGLVQLANNVKATVDFNGCKFTYKTDSQYNTAKTFVSYNWPEECTITFNNVEVVGTRNNDNIWKVVSSNSKVKVVLTGTNTYTYNGEEISFETYLR